MTFKEGDIVQIEYTARDPETGSVLDTTQADQAKTAGVYTEKGKYEALTVIVGDNELLPALNNNIKEMKIGEAKTVHISPKEGFGERNPDFVRVVPLQEFRNRNITPFPGLVVDLNDMQGKVQTVSGGRVRVDFNHPLAGKTLEYQVKVISEIKELNEKVKAIVQKYLPETSKNDIQVKGKEVKIIIPIAQYAKAVQAQPIAAKTVLNACKELERVEFVHAFTPEDFKGKKENLA